MGILDWLLLALIALWLVLGIRALRRGGGSCGCGGCSGDCASCGRDCKK